MVGCEWVMIYTMTTLLPHIIVKSLWPPRRQERIFPTKIFGWLMRMILRQRRREANRQLIPKSLEGHMPRAFTGRERQRRERGRRRRHHWCRWRLVTRNLDVIGAWSIKPRLHCEVIVITPRLV